MELYVYDNRSELPSHFKDFFAINSTFGPITLITNANRESCSGIKSLNIVPIQQLGKLPLACAIFDRIYVHLSTNSQEFEKLCFYRWFAYDFASSSLDDSDYLCILDSDQAIFVKPEQILDACALLNDNQMPELITWLPDSSDAAVVEAGPALTILTKRCLHAFCNYILETFYDQLNLGNLNSYYYESLLSDCGSSVSDMTALGHFAFSGTFSTFNLRKFFLSSNKYFCCENVLYYFTSYYTGRIFPSFENAYFLLSGTRVILKTDTFEAPVFGLHFQGGSKPLMNLFHNNSNIINVGSFESYLKSQACSRELPPSNTSSLIRVAMGKFFRGSYAFVRKSVLKYFTV